MPGASLDEYLEAAYILETEGVPVIGARLAEHLGVRPPSVTEAIRRLEKHGYVTMDAHHVVHFTPEGRSRAQSLVRRHRIAERWLTDVLGFDWAQADAEAEKLAYAFSDDVANRLNELMHSPSTCPHGNPIPKPGGDAPDVLPSGPSLDDAPVGVEMEVERVVEHAEVDLKLLRYLWGQGLVPGTRVTVIDRVPGAGTVTILRNGEEIIIGQVAASKVHVRPVAALAATGGAAAGRSQPATP